MTGDNIQDTINEIFGLIDECGNTTYAGEEISQLQHMCQAAELAELDTMDEEIILAAFFHDIGHLIRLKGLDLSEKSHETAGAEYLRKAGFSETVVRLVAGHVNAKRYLITTSEQYLKELSEVSRKNVEQQGGKMDEKELKAFEEDELFRIHIRMRTWDDRAKVTQVDVPDLEKYREMTLRHLRTEKKAEPRAA